MSITVTHARANEARLSFGPFTIDVARRTVSRDGTPLRLTLKCVELLIAFVRRPGQTLSKEELIQAAWHDPAASDATLAQHVFLLRRALDCGENWIRTVPNVGYQFTGAVRAEGSGSSATEQFLRGAATFASLMTQQGLQSAIDLYGYVLNLDDLRADAYAARARCRRLLAQYMFVDPLGALSEAKRDALDAVQRDPVSGEALIEAAYSYALFDRDLSAAAAYATRARNVQPHHPELPRLQVSVALMRGDLESALSIAGERPGPLRATLLYLMREYEQACDIFRTQLADPLIRLLFGACRLFQGDVQGAREDFAAVYHAEADVRQAPQPNVSHYALAFLTYANARSGNEGEARRGILNLAQLGRKRYVSPMARAIAHAGLNEHDAAISFVEEAVAHADPWSAHIGVDPFLEPLRIDPRFARLARIVSGARAA